MHGASMWTYARLGGRGDYGRQSRAGKAGRRGSLKGGGDADEVTACNDRATEPMPLVYL